MSVDAMHNTKYLGRLVAMYNNTAEYHMNLTVALIFSSHDCSAVGQNSSLRPWC
jgi:hypothetical protein